MQEHVCILSPSLICRQGILKVDISKVLLYSHNQLLICNTKKTPNQPKTKTTKKQPTNPHNSEPLRSCFFQTLKYFCIKGLGSLIFAYLAVRNVFRKREMLWERMGYGGKCSAVLPRATAVQLFERLEENPESSMPKCVDSAKKPDAAMGSIMYLF